MYKKTSKRTIRVFNNPSDIPVDEDDIIYLFRVFNRNIHQLKAGIHQLVIK